MGQRPVFLGARDAEAAPLAGILPLFHLHSPLFGHHVVSVPLLNSGGPIGTPAARQALAAWALDHARREGAKSVILRSRTAVPGDLPRDASKVTVLLGLPESADTMWQKSFDAKFRNKIKRPQREGMETHFGVEHLDAFYEVFAANMRDLGTPVLPRRLFERIVAALSSHVLLGVTYWKGRPVAGGFGITWRREFEMTWSSSLREVRAAKPNMLLYWDYMRTLIAQGVKVFNFGRSTPGTGPHEFKLSWGAVDEPLPWVQWPGRQGGAGEGGVAGAASAVWRRLPVGLTRAVGPTVARQLPWW